MKDILDIDMQEKTKNKKSRKSFRYFLLSVACLVTVMIVTILYFSKANSDLADLLKGIPSLLFMLLTILGFKNAIQSVKEKERWSSKKVIGLIGNTVFFGVFFLLLLANLIDLFNFYFAR